MLQVRSSRGLVALLLWLSASACAAPERDGPISPDAIWTEAEGHVTPRSRIMFSDRADGHRYGLPAKGQASLADLIAVFPAQGIGPDDPDMFIAKGVQEPGDSCRGGTPAVAPALPMTVEAVVTLYPRAYLKLAVCGHDERFYGSYTVEDDTGGLVVLRDSRVAQFTFGDRVRLTVTGLMLTYGPDPDTRAVLIASVDSVEKTAGDPVLFERTHEAFAIPHVGRVHRVEGYVVSAPSNDNFNKLVLSDRPLAAAGASPDRVPEERLNCALVCEAACDQGACGAVPDLCGPICTNLCTAAPAGEFIPPASLPICWVVGLSAELGRRGLTYAYGEKLQVTGPVVHQYDRQIWVQDPTQIESLH